MNTDDQIRQLFESASKQVSLNAHYRLEQAAQAAIRSRALPPVTPRRSWLQFGLGGGAIAAAVVGLALFLPPHNQTAPQAALTASSTAPAAPVSQGQTGAIKAAALPDDSTAWDEDPAFYAWLTSPEAKSVAFN